MAILAGVEYQTYFMERAAGKYLNRVNLSREPWGTAWERQEKLRETAAKLDEEAAETGKLRQQLEKVDNFAELFNLLPDGRGINISPGKFVELYKALPLPLRGQVIDPTSLTDYYLSSEWQRTSLWQREDGATAYLVNARNQVISHLKITRGLVHAASIYGKESPGRLIEKSRYTDNIFTRQEFFEALSKRTEVERLDIFGVPDLLLELPQVITAVGISLPAISEEFALVAFETVGANGVSIITYPVQPEYIELVMRELRGEPTDTSKVTTPADSVIVTTDSLNAGGEVQ